MNEEKAERIFKGLSAMGLIANPEECIYVWNTIWKNPGWYKIPKPDKWRLRNYDYYYEDEPYIIGDETHKPFELIIWGGTNGELGCMATLMYGANRWDVLRHYYRFPGDRNVNIRSVQSRIANTYFPIDWPKIYNLF